MWKDNRGFSFVELMTVLVILCVMVIASYPVVIRVMGQSKNKLYKENVSELKRAGIAWATAHVRDLPDDEADARFLSIHTLAKEGYIRTDEIPDPRHKGEYMSGCIMIKKSGKQYRASFYEESCNKAGRDYAPRIKVEEAGSDTYEVGSTTPYVMPTIVAKSITGKELEVSKPVIKKNASITTDQVKGDAVGDRYEITYRVLDPDNGISSTYQYQVKVVDTQAPVIEVEGQTIGYTTSITEGESYVIPEATVQDNSKGKVRLNVSTDLNTDLLGEYEIVYTAVDERDNFGILVVKVNVVADELLPENQIIVDNALALPGDGVLKKQQNGTYLFQGKNPNNYLEWSGELWRVVSISPTGIKLVSTTSTTNMSWSDKNSARFIDSRVYSYLNHTFYKTLSDTKYLVDQNFNIANINMDGMKTKEQIAREESHYQTTEKFKVGLLNVSDYVNASSSNRCLANGKGCNEENYLQPVSTMLLSNPLEDAKAIYVATKSGIATISVTANAEIYPVVSIRGYQTLLGTGSLQDPYRILEK